MSVSLPIKTRSSQLLVAVNVNNRISVFDGATEYEITNSPNTTPALGGKFPVYDGATEYKCNYLLSGGGTSIGSGTQVTAGHIASAKGGLVYGLGA